MNARDDILRDYAVENGRITSPGKFEGESIYAPYFYDMSLDGFGSSFRILPEDRAAFPEIPKRKQTIRVIEDDNGFVYIR